MKKSILQHVLPFAVLMVSAAMITACEKGGARTPKDAILKAKCERGLDTSAENQALAADLIKNSKLQSDIAVRTYITKFDIKDTTKPSLLNPNNAVLVSAQTPDAFLSAEDSDAITVTTNCGNLTATVQGRNFKIENLTIKDVKLQSIELTRTDIETREDINVKIEKSARLQTSDLDLQKQIDDKTVKNKHLLKASLKSSKANQMARGNVVTKVTIEVKGATTQSYVIEQYSGELFDDTRIAFDKSVLAMIKDRTESVGTPDFIENAILATTQDVTTFAMSGALKKATDLVGGHVVDAGAAEEFEQAKTIDEADAINELRQKLAIAAGLDVAKKNIDTYLNTVPATEVKKLESEIRLPEAAAPTAPTLAPSETVKNSPRSV